MRSLCLYCEIALEIKKIIFYYSPSSEGKLMSDAPGENKAIERLKKIDVYTA